MSNRYKALKENPAWDWEQDDEFEASYTAEEEAFFLDEGILELLPNTYRNVGGSKLVLAGEIVVEPGDVFDAAFPQRQELLLGSHLERVKPDEEDEADEPEEDDEAEEEAE